MVEPPFDSAILSYEAVEISIGVEFPIYFRIFLPKSQDKIAKMGYNVA
jgi:hypothetical protein